MSDGIMYLSDETGDRRFIQIDLAVHGGEMLEDLVDVLVAEARRGEETVPLAEALDELRRAGKLDDRSNAMNRPTGSGAEAAASRA